MDSLETQFSVRSNPNVTDIYAYQNSVEKTNLNKKLESKPDLAKIALNLEPLHLKVLMDLRVEMTHKRFSSGNKKRATTFKNPPRYRINANKELNKLKQYLKRRNLNNSLIFDVIQRETILFRNEGCGIRNKDIKIKEWSYDLKPEITNDEFEKNIETKSDVLVNITQKNENCTFIGSQAINTETVLPIQQDTKYVTGAGESKLARKYTAKWMCFVQKRKDEKRKKQLDQFFEGLIEKKKRIVDSKKPSDNNTAKKRSKDYTNYQHKYKVQQNIIALQKVKIEHQNRLIEQYKFKQISEASNNQQSLKEDMESCKKFDARFKRRIKCLKNELRLEENEKEEPDFVLYSLKVPTFLKKMEQRAKDRAEKHALIKERRKLMEEEKIRAKQQADLDKLEMDREEKIRHMEEMRRKRAKEKLETIRRKQLEERMHTLTAMADLYYERKLLGNYGLNALKRAIEIKRSNEKTSMAYSNQRTQKIVFKSWYDFTKKFNSIRMLTAERHYKLCVFRKVFAVLKLERRECIINTQVAEDYYDFKITCKMFRMWKKYHNKIVEEDNIKCAEADKYFTYSLLAKVLARWRSLPLLEILHREQEARKSRWRKRVLNVVPDYTPVSEFD